MISENFATAKTLLEEKLLFSDFNTDSEKNKKGRGQRKKFKPLRLQLSDSDETSQNSDSSSQSSNQIPDPPTEEDESLPMNEQQQEPRLESDEDINNEEERFYHTTELLEEEEKLSYTTDPLQEEQFHHTTSSLDNELFHQTTEERFEENTGKSFDVSKVSAEEKRKKDGEVEKQVTSLVKYRKGKKSQTWQEHSKTLLKMIVEHSDSKLFRELIDEKTYPGYYSKLDFKIDLSYIISNLEVSHIFTFQKCLMA